jgi:small basic protein (TIGR04137 family)
MSLHPSLKGSTKIVAKRNVLKRFERISQLMKESRWKAGENKVFGLPKTKVLE